MACRPLWFASIVRARFVHKSRNRSISRSRLILIVYCHFLYLYVSLGCYARMPALAILHGTRLLFDPRPCTSRSPRRSTSRPASTPSPPTAPRPPNSCPDSWPHSGACSLASPESRWWSAPFSAAATGSSAWWPPPCPSSSRWPCTRCRTRPVRSSRFSCTCASGRRCWRSSAACRGSPRRSFSSSWGRHCCAASFAARRPAAAAVALASWPRCCCRSPALLRVMLDGLWPRALLVDGKCALVQLELWLGRRVILASLPGDVGLVGVWAATLDSASLVVNFVGKL